MMAKEYFKPEKNNKIAVVGLGYVGLPLAAEFGKLYEVIGFDVDKERLAQLKEGHDKTCELTAEQLAKLGNVSFTSDILDIKDCNIYIITVPTPIDSSKRPDLLPLINASKTVGKVLKKNDVVVYESTVYPGATEEECVPVLERVSGLTFNSDFFCGYSPERINPGDKDRRLNDIVKVTSGSTPRVADFIDSLYISIINAGTHKAASIRVAEAAKVIENTQRDVNIALINELAIIFNKLGLDTEAVLQAAGTKWNFLPFRPGLVGGHCIGVDPYYLTHKAEAIGYHPQVILSGRQINDGMGLHVANQLIRKMINTGIELKDARVLVLGLTFKENCPDLRNNKIVDVIKELTEYRLKVDVHDPLADPKTAQDIHGLTLCELPERESYDAVILAVAHTCFVKEGPQKFRKFGKDKHVFYDLKSVFKANESDLRL